MDKFYELSSQFSGTPILRSPSLTFETPIYSSENEPTFILNSNETSQRQTPDFVKSPMTLSEKMARLIRKPIIPEADISKILIKPASPLKTRTNLKKSESMQSLNRIGSSAMAMAQDDSALLDKLAELVDKTIAFGSKSQLSLNRSMTNLKRADSKTSLRTPAKETEIIKVEPKPIFRMPSVDLLNESGLVVSTKRRIITSPESIESDSDLIQRLEEIMEKSAAENIRKDTIKEESEPIDDVLDELLDRSANISSRMSLRRNISSRASNTPIPRIPSMSNLPLVLEEKPNSSISIPVRVVSSTSTASIQNKPKPLPARTISSTSTRPDASSRVQSVPAEEIPKSSISIPVRTISSRTSRADTSSRVQSVPVEELPKSSLSIPVRTNSSAIEETPNASISIPVRIVSSRSRTETKSSVQDALKSPRSSSASSRRSSFSETKRSSSAPRSPTKEVNAEISSDRITPSQAWPARSISRASSMSLLSRKLEKLVNETSGMFTEDLTIPISASRVNLGSELSLPVQIKQSEDREETKTPATTRSPSKQLERTKEIRLTDLLMPAPSPTRSLGSTRVISQAKLDSDQELSTSFISISPDPASPIMPEEPGLQEGSAYVAGTQKERVLPPEQHKLNVDPNPTVVKKKPMGSVKYIQKVILKLLKPPPAPQPGDITIEQEQDVQVPPATPLIVREKPPQPDKPEPLVLREKPPKKPDPIAPKHITIPGKVIPPPPRKVIKEILPKLPPLPEDLIIERWLGYDRRTRDVVFRPAAPIVPLPAPKNVLIEWESPEADVKKEIVFAGVEVTDPDEYQAKYGGSLLEAHQLPEEALKISIPDGHKLAVDSNSNELPLLTGDVKSLKLINLKCHDLEEYSAQV